MGKLREKKSLKWSTLKKYFSTDVQQKFDFFEGKCISIKNFAIQMDLILFVKSNIVKFATTKKSLKKLDSFCKMHFLSQNTQISKRCLKYEKLHFLLLLGPRDTFW